MAPANSGWVPRRATGVWKEAVDAVLPDATSPLSDALSTFVFAVILIDAAGGTLLGRPGRIAAMCSAAVTVNQTRTMLKDNAKLAIAVAKTMKAIGVSTLPLRRSLFLTAPSHDPLLRGDFGQYVFQRFPAAADISRHPGQELVVRALRAASVAREEEAIALDLVDPPDVQALLISYFKNHWELPVPILAHFFKQVCDAVEFLHALGIVHCDLHNENVCVTRSGNIKLVDFGSSTRHGCWNLFPDKPWFPSEVRGKSAMADESVDMFGLGHILRNFLYCMSGDEEELWATCHQLEQRKADRMALPQLRREPWLLREKSSPSVSAAWPLMQGRVLRLGPESLTCGSRVRDVMRDKKGVVLYLSHGHAQQEPGYVQSLAGARQKFTDGIVIPMADTEVGPGDWLFVGLRGDQAARPGEPDGMDRAETLLPGLTAQVPFWMPYVRVHMPSWASGKTFRELAVTQFPDVKLAGVARGGRVIQFPEDDFKVRFGDYALLLRSSEGEQIDRRTQHFVARFATLGQVARWEVADSFDAVPIRSARSEISEWRGQMILGAQFNGRQDGDWVYIRGVRVTGATSHVADGWEINGQYLESHSVGETPSFRHAESGALISFQDNVWRLQGSTWSLSEREIGGSSTWSFECEGGHVHVPTGQWSSKTGAGKIQVEADPCFMKIAVGQRVLLRQVGGQRPSSDVPSSRL